MDEWSPWVGVGVLLALTVFSTMNVALRFQSRVRLAEQFEKIGQGKRFEAFVVRRPQYILATAMLRSIATLAILLIALSMAESPDVASMTTRRVIACGAALFLVLVLAVAIPNAWAKYRGVWLVVRGRPLLVGIRFLCLPLIKFLEVFDPLIRRLSGVPVRDAKSYADELEQEILDVVSEGERHGAVDEQEREMIESIFELADTRVEEIMTPRTDMVALAKETDLRSVLQTVRAKGHSRIPVYDETIDTVLGVLYAKDLLVRDERKPFKLTEVMRKVLFIPESKHVRELLREFQSQNVHIAIVLDEYGGTAGLVTIEDILEELVGEIRDEYDPTAPAELKRLDELTVEVDARMRIDDLNDELDIELPEDGDYETIGGFVFSQMGRIPEVGARCEWNDLAIVVLAAEARRINRLRLHVPPPSLNSQPSE